MGTLNLFFLPLKYLSRLQYKYSVKKGRGYVVEGILNLVLKIWTLANGGLN